PSTIPGSKYNRMALQRTPVGTPRDQGLITKWSEKDKRGYGLFIDKSGAIALKMGDGKDVETISTGVKLRPWAPALGGPEAYFSENHRPMHVNNSGWYFVAATYNSATKKVSVTQRPMAGVPDNTKASVNSSVGDGLLRHSATPLMMGAYS